MPSDESNDVDYRMDDASETDEGWPQSNLHVKNTEHGPCLNARNQVVEDF